MTVLEPILAYLDGRKQVSLERAVAETGLPRRPVLRVLDKLAAEGFLAEIADEPVAPGLGECGPPRQSPTWQVIRPVLERVNHNHRRSARRVSDRDRLWKVIRAKRRFTRAELQITVACPRSSVDEYTKVLRRNGVIREIGRNGLEKVFLLVKDCGPKRPTLREFPAREVRS